MKQILHLRSIGLLKDVFSANNKIIVKIEVLHHPNLGEVYFFLPEEDIKFSVIFLYLMKMKDEGHRILMTFEGQVTRIFGKSVPANLSSRDYSHFDESLLNQIGILDKLLDCYVDGNFMDMAEFL